MTTAPEPEDSASVASRGLGALKHQVRAGIGVVAATQIVSQLLSLIVLGVLYRLLGPDPFGLFGMVLPWLLFLRSFATWGLNVASVQRQDLSSGEASSAFWFNVSLAAVVSLATLAAAPAVAWFYREPELAWLTAALAGTSLVSALGMQHQALMERQLHWGRLAGARLLAQFAAGAAAIGIALYGGTVTALVAGQYAELLILAVAVWTLERWRPMLPGRGASITHLLGFGRAYTASGIAFTVLYNMDKVFIGRMLGEQALGLYGQAFNIAMKPAGVLTAPLTGIMIPALSRARNDLPAFTTMLVAFFRLAAVVSFPAGVGLAIVADETMRLLGDEPWWDAGPLLAVLAGVMLVQSFINIAGSVFASAGRADRLFYGAAALAVGVIPGLAAGLALGYWIEWPTLGVAIGYTGWLVVVLAPIYLSYCFKTVRVEPLVVFRALLPPLWAALLMGVVTLGAKLWLISAGVSPITRLPILMAIGGLSYAWFGRGEIRWFLGQWKKSRSRPEA